MSRDPFIGGSDPQKNPYEDLFKQMDQDKEPLFSKKKEKGLKALVAVALKKIIDLFTFSAEKSISKAEKFFIEEDLEKLIKAFKQLKEEDLSQVWHDFEKNYHRLYKNKNSLVAQLIEQLIKEISSYPQDEENNMEFYLSQYAGQDWLPFPYMEIIQRLYLYDKNILEKWIDLLEQTIFEVKKRKLIRNNKS